MAATESHSIKYRALLFSRNNDTRYTVAAFRKNPLEALILRETFLTQTRRRHGFTVAGSDPLRISSDLTKEGERTINNVEKTEGKVVGRCCFFRIAITWKLSDWPTSFDAGC